MPDQATKHQRAWIARATLPIIFPWKEASDRFSQQGGRFKGLRCRNHNRIPRVVPTVDNEVTFFSKKTPQYPIPCGKKRAMWDVSPLLDGPTCYCGNGPHHKVQRDEVHCFRILFGMTNLKVNKGWMRIKLMWDTNCEVVGLIISSHRLGHRLAIAAWLLSVTAGCSLLFSG